MIRLPLISLPEVYHVGSMSPADKRPDSYEGAGLSVSLHPSAWRSIARGHFNGDCWRLIRPDATFLDARSLSRRARRAIADWAVDQGYAVHAPVWRWRYWDEDLNDHVVQHFINPDEAHAEREFLELGTVRRLASHHSTPALDAAAMQSRTSLSTNSVIDLVLPLWANEVHAIQAIWWDDRYDPLDLSAPRGVIHPAALPLWQADRLSCDPDGDDTWS